MNKMYEWSNVFYFIGLQMPDKMPADVGRKLRLLIHQFLYVVLPEIPLPQVIEGPYVFGRLGFGDGDKLRLSVQFSEYLLVFFRIDSHDGSFGKYTPLYPFRMARLIT